MILGFRVGFPLSLSPSADSGNCAVSLGLGTEGPD